ncbi:hypothetical protein BU25DRAFT_5853 [Macroventuria anomochaeta]|uniref:Uncharacterized protein n=1 Tax=Macroventuria anomochaeta TaxID=301207 RepID=A0ACB6SJ70_9PLEO|nr:uncharacterized protein BU25DRAFT_5853 [Macroventuria anomochaeta]KAF2633459.1 hypothetical protein BU25DRAFT_5853 [Macroventuria anomochaeta]
MLNLYQQHNAAVTPTSVPASQPRMARAEQQVVRASGTTHDERQRRAVNSMADILINPARISLPADMQSAVFSELICRALNPTATPPNAHIQELAQKYIQAVQSNDFRALPQENQVHVQDEQMAWLNESLVASAGTAPAQPAVRRKADEDDDPQKEVKVKVQEQREGR